jgi:hypothetical protein
MEVSMLKKSKHFRVTIFISILLIFSCVTINIYFPAEKVESVAGEIVEDIRGPGSEENKGSQNKEKSALHRNHLWAVMLDTAWAAEATTVSNPTIRSLKQRMKTRFTLLMPYFKKGVLKEGSNGYVSMGAGGKLPLKERRNLKTLVDAENKDRTTLYREVAKALKIDPGQTDKIAAIFAKEWQRSLQ